MAQYVHICGQDQNRSKRVVKVSKQQGQIAHEDPHSTQFCCGLVQVRNEPELYKFVHSSVNICKPGISHFPVQDSESSIGIYLVCFIREH